MQPPDLPPATGTRSIATAHATGLTVSGAGVGPTSTTKEVLRAALLEKHAIHRYLNPPRSATKVPAVEVPREYIGEIRASWKRWASSYALSAYGQRGLFSRRAAASGTSSSSGSSGSFVAELSMPNQVRWHYFVTALDADGATEAEMKLSTAASEVARRLDEITPMVEQLTSQYDALGEQRETLYAECGRARGAHEEAHRQLLLARDTGWWTSASEKKALEQAQQAEADAEAALEVARSTLNRFDDETFDPLKKKLRNHGWEQRNLTNSQKTLASWRESLESLRANLVSVTDVERELFVRAERLRELHRDLELRGVDLVASGVSVFVAQMEDIAALLDGTKLTVAVASPGKLEVELFSSGVVEVRVGRHKSHFEDIFDATFDTRLEGAPIR
jgi:hypothetical protein